MKKMTGADAVQSPTHLASQFLAYEAECRSVFKPMLANLLEMAEAAGWDRRTVASTLMFLAAQQISTAPTASKSEI